MPNLSDKTTRPLGRVLLTGATGMVGSSVLAALLNEDSTREVVSLGRRPSGRDHEKLTEVVFSDFGDAPAIKPYLNGTDTVFHCLATYTAWMTLPWRNQSSASGFPTVLTLSGSMSASRKPQCSKLW